METNDEGAVSVRAIADAVGVSPPAIYLHFADKNELIFAVCQRHFDALDAATEQAAREGSDPLESLRRRGEAYVRFAVDNPEHYRILFMGKPSVAPASFVPEQLADAAAFNHLVENVEACIAAGLIRSDDVFLVAVGLWTLVHGVASLVITMPEFPWPPVEQLVDHVLRTHAVGLGADAAREP